MPKNVTQYDLLISCPGDICEEIQLIEQAVGEFNERYSDTLGISIRPRYWRKSSYAQSGGKPQELLNKQFVKDCDAAVALLWTRFGSPTDKYGSGTEEEIEIMLGEGKQVFMYFSEKPLPPSQYDSEEYARVQMFREKYKERGVYCTYSSNEDFSKLFFAHLSQHFLSMKKVAELSEKRAPQLCIRGIDENGRLCESPPIQAFQLNYKQSMDNLLEQIGQMYQDIAGIHLSQRDVDAGNNALMVTMNSALTTIYPPVTITSDCKVLLLQVARQLLGLTLPDDFFNLGNLSKDSLSATRFGQPSLIGTEEEKKKYKLIKQLQALITDYSDWLPVETAFCGMKCVKLAIENSGTAIDEDIEVTLTLDKEAFLLPSEFPAISNETMKHLLKKFDLVEVFGIAGTVQYMGYDSSINHVRSVNLGSQLIPLGDYDYTKDYEYALRNVFCYDFYFDENSYILKLKFDYIKHHTTVAFPTAIFLKNTLSSISYTITSQNSADIVRGSISIVEEKLS